MYAGTHSVAITAFRGDYVPRYETSPRGLRESLATDAQVLGSDYKVLAVFHGVGPNCHGMIESAIDHLRLGRPVDLEKLLS